MDTPQDLLGSAGSLQVCETKEGEVVVPGLTEEEVPDAAALEALVQRGATKLHYGATKMNETSSRSHAILMLVSFGVTCGIVDAGCCILVTTLGM
jgi:hypothetical protein